MRMHSLLIIALTSSFAVGCRSDNSETKDTVRAKAAENSERKAMSEVRVVSSKDGTQIGFEATGKGPALVVVSGALSHRALPGVRPLAAALAPHFTVYLYDRRGRGESTDTQPYAVEREIEDIEALIDR